MKSIVETRSGSLDVPKLKQAGKPVCKDIEKAEAFADLERGVHAALETYSNVHRGSGHNSLASTHLYEKAREIVLKVKIASMDWLA